MHAKVPILLREKHSAHNHYQQQNIIQEKVVLVLCLCMLINLKFLHKNVNVMFCQC